MKKTVKTACRGYFLTDYEDKEKWLHEMNRQGWQLTAAPFPYFYRFEKTEPQDIIWRLEFHPEAENREDYISMAEDYGWRCLKGVNS
ncbi:MAG: DUF2812 domain-containing protein [Solobacterium sp.]|jgi:hypothetical protein|nr:DUF2812 domain-containing protein [Solobacterium sp.]MCH4047870.1 DUF2812 domain-containing protein [Solobacterium sp.]MCH4075544.1 DUF2812 domain-containing protein [Solobacterium sp.]MCI1313260.1 DUF2812 domain-containing protein [Solobacterium sp.]MCI1346030.1 DUF2812 domain-containing protein [Solobacterium sp.]